MCVDCTNSINDTPQGTSGENGVSSYIYIATATDDSGSGFALYTDNPTQCYKAILTSSTPISNPQASDFTDLWFNTCGTPGADGEDGTGSTGARGAAASITLGTVATGAAGSNVIITNSGTTNDAVFNFTIPRGNTGSAGADGAVWTNGSGAPGSTLTVGDYYLNTTNGDVYTNTGSGNTIVANIMGATGATGNTGSQGPAGADGTPQDVTSNDNSITIDSTTTPDTFDLSVNFTDGRKYIPYDNATYPHDYDAPSYGTNGRYMAEPPWATMLNYTVSTDLDTYPLFAYNAAAGTNFTAADSNRIQYKKNSDGSVNVKGFLRKIVTSNGSGVIDFQASTLGVVTSGAPATTENGVDQGAIVDNSLIWMYPMIGLNLTDIDFNGFIPCTIYLDTQGTGTNAPNNYLYASSTKLNSFQGLFYISKNSLRLYCSQSISGLSNSTAYTLGIFINGTI